MNTASECASSATRQYHDAIDWDDAGNRTVADVLSSDSPCLVARMGLSESWCASFYSRWRGHGLFAPPYPQYSRQLMHVNAGVFPDDDATLDRFAQVYLKSISQADVMAVWFNRGEATLLKEHSPRTRLIELNALNAMCYENPWTSALAGKTVLVIHPFAASIESQYRTHRTELFDDPAVLPEFTLKTLKPVQSIAGTPSGFSDWFAALADTQARIAAEQFDIAIIGAGAYGLPLGAFVKGLGKQAVHLGGATQLLFGIKGRRWETEYADTIAPLFNEHWVRPSAEETPPEASDVEGACYW